MPLGEAQRKVAFGVALAVLALGAAAMSFLGGDGSNAGSSVAGETSSGAASPGLETERLSDIEVRGAAVSATRFLRAYLRYQEADLRGVDRRAIARYAAPGFGEQLLRAPVRIPPGGRAPRQVVASVTSVRAGLFEGQAALLASALIAGSTGTHLLHVTLVRPGARWVVSGVGP